MKPSSRPPTAWIVLAILLVIAAGIFATMYGTLLSTRVAPGRTFKILGPTTLTAGQSATITWDTSPQNAARYPLEKIEYCYGKLLKRKCVVLAVATPNNGQAKVKVPASLPPGQGTLKLTARDKNKKLFASLTATSPVVVTSSTSPASRSTPTNQPSPSSLRAPTPRPASPTPLPIACRPADPPSVVVVAPNNGGSYQRGTAVPIQWKTCNAPANSWVGLAANTAYVALQLPVNQPTFSWTIPPNTYCGAWGSDICYAQALQGSDFRIEAHLYQDQGPNSCLGFCAPGSTAPQLLSSDKSDLPFTIGP